jgi:PEP-CTERM putative exosortase interaction domain
MRRTVLQGFAALFSLVFLPSIVRAADGTLRVATWNVTDYGGAGARDAHFQNVFYGTFEGRQFAPDVLLGQEFLSQAAVTSFVNLLNSAAGSPGDWAAAPFLNGPDTDSALFYRTSKIAYLSTSIVSTGGVNPEPPRNTYRYDVRILGGAEDSQLALYSTHMASQSNPSSRRLIEAQRIREDAESLAPGTHFLIGGDFNITSSFDAAYIELTGSQANDAGRFFDPIETPGDWNNNAAYRFVHTQAPGLGTNTGGMDDRFDFLLTSASLGDGTGWDYVGAFGVPYSATSWDDFNHSYRVWGNDGTSFNTSLTTTGNQMVGQSIAQSLVATAPNGGHLPVFMDLRFNAVAVPEPGTGALLALGGLLLLAASGRLARRRDA